MNRTRRNWLVGALLTSGPTLIGMPSAKDAFESQCPGCLPSLAWTLLPLLGVFVLVLGAALWLVVRIPLPTLMPSYECYAEKESDLSNIYDLAISELGSGVSPLNKMTTWHRKNRKIFKVVYKVRRKGPHNSKSFVGYYCVIPITPDAVGNLKSKEITGAQFLPEHIVEEGKEAAAVYVGGIVARGLLAQGNTRSVLHNDLMGYWAKIAKEAYTKPVTCRGLELVKDYGFTAVDVAVSGQLDALYMRPIVA